MSKVDTIKAAMPPKRYAINKPNGVLNAVLTALGTADQTITDQIKAVKDQVFLETSEGRNLDRLGSNYGVPRPSLSVVSDAVYRELIRHIAFQPHNALNICRTVLTDLLGEPGSTSWEMVSGVTAGQITIEIYDATATGTLDQTYFHPSTKNFDVQYIGSGLAATISVDGTGITTDVDGVGDLSLTFAANPTVDDMATAIDGDPDYVVTNIRADATTTASSEIDTLTDIDIKTEPFKLYSLVDGGTLNAYFGDYFVADATIDADDPVNGVSDRTSPDNPIRYIIVAFDTSDETAEEVILTVKAAGIKVVVRTIT